MYRVYVKNIFQSTPPRGWRLCLLCMAQRIAYFNPLHHEGGDGTDKKDLSDYVVFQSTPPRGWRRYKSNDDRIGAIFQSTPPRGWRPVKGKDTFRCQFISIHSTTRVETRLYLHTPMVLRYFNPLHHEGGDDEY